ncbi:MurR/RpiR family transcriptional regulator (plasmid) [Cetobacterium somerae]|uniref:MurR/RpiR family transcriptional regulator n=1 Tax=Cetobacterium somerae TaxID=188913 RepID=UPI003D768E4D
MPYKVLELLQTREIREKLTKAEEEILDFLEKNFSRIPDITVLEICKEAYTSQGSINRLCKKLGFAGFSDLKFSIKEDILEREKYKKESITNTLFFIENINMKEGKKLSQVLKDTPRILLYGLGASKITATYLQRQLLYLGFQVIFISEEKMLENFNDFTLLVISSSGETLRIKHVAKSFKERGNTLLSITKKGSYLDKLSDCSFTHNISIDKLNVITREQQLHMIIMVNELVNLLHFG